jgi:sigma-54 dependent transcriptional regulator
LNPLPIVDAEAEEIAEPKSLNLNDFERKMVVEALEKNGGNRKKAARDLGISDRTLYRRIRQYGLDEE